MSTWFPIVPSSSLPSYLSETAHRIWATQNLMLTQEGYQESRRADLRTADLLITSEQSGVAGACTGLQTPHI
jgi:hypothetical protein